MAYNELGVFKYLSFFLLFLLLKHSLFLVLLGQELGSHFNYLATGEQLIRTEFKANAGNRLEFNKVIKV